LTTDLNDLSLLLDSKVPILVIESFEEPRVLEMITRLAVNRASPLFTWSATEGLNRLGFGERVDDNEDTKDPAKVLNIIKDSSQPGIYVLCDFHPYFKDEPLHIRLLREIAMRHNMLGHTVVLLSHALSLPNELKRYSARFELAMPDEDQLMNLVREEANNWSKSGETERNLREALKLADLMSPCVLWLDEIEKGISVSQNDSGISQRILGTLLTWMSERESQVFIVATSNDITQLPPELVRKGRLDEIFSVDLPEQNIRKDIFEIHLKKRHEDPAHFDLKELAIISEGFSGAEIEQTIVSALYSAAGIDEKLSNTQLTTAIRSTNPLSVVMSENIASLRHWTKERCVFAD